MNRFWGGLLGFALILLIINFTLLSPETRWVMPKSPEPFEGSKCLWFDNRPDNVCAVWNIYTKHRSPAAPDTGGFEDACTAAGRKVVYHGVSDGPVRDLWVNAWACK